MVKRKGMTREQLLRIIKDAALERCKDVDLAHQGIAKLPDEIGQLANLENLDLSGNQLRSLPQSFAKLTKLRGLKLRHNRLSSVPQLIGRLANLRWLDLASNALTSLPESLGQLRNLEALTLYGNKLATVPSSIEQLQNLRGLDLAYCELTSLPESLAGLARLESLHLEGNNLASLPSSLGKLAKLQTLDLGSNRFSSLPESIDQLTGLLVLHIDHNKLTSLPHSVGELRNLRILQVASNEVISLPHSIGRLKSLETLCVLHNGLKSLPNSIGQLRNLKILDLQNNRLASLPESIGRLRALRTLRLQSNRLTSLPESMADLNKLAEMDVSSNLLGSVPPSFARLPILDRIQLAGNPLNPALASAYERGLHELQVYLQSLEETAQREKLYEAKLVLVGEGAVGKTTLLKAMTGKDPRKDEPTTHGVSIDIKALCLGHPSKDGVEIRLNSWDFGGQEVYRVTHQFFFSRRSVYLLVWEPRRGVQQCQVEDWLKLIRLRVGHEARVIIVSTHCRSGGRIARVDKPVLQRDFGPLILGFHEVDSLVNDPETGDKVGIKKLKEMIANAAQDLEQMGMEFNRDWVEARDELLAKDEPCVSYAEFARVCGRHGLDPAATKTLANLMHDLGYIVYYGDDERLKDDVVLQPEWLTKAIGFVLEDRTTQEMDGILPDSRLKEVWCYKPADGRTKFDHKLYPFFLRLMERFDVSYRLEEGTASLVAQHVPQVRPSLPWLPDEEPKLRNRRIAMVCTMDEAPPGLVPWMIVRTHEYAYERPAADSKVHRLHWQKGMFLRYRSHGEALLELRGREFHANVEAVWPEYFMNVLRQTLHKLISDNWPGMKDHYSFTVPCRERSHGKPCEGRFHISALHKFLQEGDEMIRCQVCLKRENILHLLYGFEKLDLSEQLRAIKGKLDGLESRTANYFWAIMQAIATESKLGPWLFTIEPTDGNWKRLTAKRYCIRLWCEAEGCQHPVVERGKGVYELSATRGWVKRVAPYANFIAGVLKTVLPIAAPAANVFLGKDTIDQLGIEDHLDLMEKATGTLLKGELDVSDRPRLRQGVLSEAQRSGILALHSFLREIDPNHEKLGLKRMPTYTGDFVWLCEEHYKKAESKIPDKIPDRDVE